MGPTNDAGEREARRAVCWRETSYGTDSERGSRFVERTPTVIGSCRRESRNVLAFLTDAVRAHRTGAKAPWLLATESEFPVGVCKRSVEMQTPHL